MAWFAVLPACGLATENGPSRHASGGLTVALDARSGAADRLSEAGGRVEWLHGPILLSVTNEATRKTGRPANARISGRLLPGLVRILPAIGLTLTERWSRVAGGLAWDLSFTGAGLRAGHEVALELPVLSPRCSVFTPTERGVVRVAACPTVTLTPYGQMGYSAAPARFNVLPLVSVLDPSTDRALTIAIPPDANIPDLRIDWRGGRVLRLRLGHRAMGGGKPATLRLLFLAHPADYRCALRAYAALYPRWFEPALPRGRYEGAFYYHHIQDHPDFGEMARQDVRYIWASFWFTFLGEYMPDGPEWYPYTYAKWWKLGQTMSDAKIRAFVREMSGHGIGTYAYFNVTEYGGDGGQGGNAAEAARQLRERFGSALMKDERGQDIPTWEGAMAMNADPRYALFPYLQDQVRRHLTRVPEIAGFCIDRLDWASATDYGHDDGQTMIGARAVTNMAGPVAAGVGEVCRLAHAAGKRVFVNQFWRVEPLKDADGYCHESDYVRGLGYLSPYRPVSAWHQQRDYGGDLLPFEAQLKLRLQFAVFPQMIAHSFPISQQGASPRAADMLEVYAPLFRTLLGKRQVLLPHCVSVDGANDADLFRDGAGRYVAVVTSRVRFLSRGGGVPGHTNVVLQVPDASKLRWAHVVSGDGPEYRAAVRHTGRSVTIVVPRHVTASCAVVGLGPEPPLAVEPEGVVAARARVRPPVRGARGAIAEQPMRDTLSGLIVQVNGQHVGTSAGDAVLYAFGRRLGALRDGVNRYQLPAPPGVLTGSAPAVRVETAEEGAWFAPESVALLARLADGRVFRVARWACGTGRAEGPAFGTRLLLDWCHPEQVVRSTAAYMRVEAGAGGNWRGRVGGLAAWLPGAEPATRSGFALSVTAGTDYAWAETTPDTRALDQAGGTRRASCWFDDRVVALTVTPPDAVPYVLTLYELDYDRNGRACDVEVSDEGGVLARRTVTRNAMAAGAYVSWRVTGPATVRVRKTAGYNAVLSGVFIDRPTQP